MDYSALIADDVGQARFSAEQRAVHSQPAKSARNNFSSFENKITHHFSSMNMNLL